MLDGIDSIDWASLRHAYGSAADVPGLLRALASPDEVKRKNAIYELFGNIWHQGTVYPATAAAVPFLYDLLNAPNVPPKSEIAALLACIAVGSGYLEVHSVGDFGEKTWRDIVSEKGKSLEDEIEREATETNRVRRAAAARLLDLLPYLRDSEPENRRVVAEAFGCYPEYQKTTLPELRKIAATETDEEVQVALAESIERLEGAEV
ncbi:MAG: hypothetical protein ACTHM6_15420 [Tepidisphaeraceae bacterium]